MIFPGISGVFERDTIAAADCNSLRSFITVHQRASINNQPDTSTYVVADGDEITMMLLSIPSSYRYVP